MNLAAKLLGSGEVYRLLGTVTHGNLFLLSQNTEIEYDKDNLSQLVGKTVGVIQLANVPGLTFKSVLNKYGIPWVEMGNGDEVAADKVNLKALTDASEVIPNGGCDVYLAPEPAASLKVSKTPLAFVGNLQTLYGGSNGYPQAVIVAKKSVIDAYPELISSLKKDLSDTSAWLLADSTDPDVIVDAIAKFATPGMTPSLNKNNLSKDAVRNSGVWFTPSSDCKEEIVAFLQSVMEINPASAAVPADVFFEN